jgi:hypothetical protein
MSNSEAESPFQWFDDAKARNVSKVAQPAPSTQAASCVNGHDIDPSASFCSVCSGPNVAYDRSPAAPPPTWSGGQTPYGYVPYGASP